MGATSVGWHVDPVDASRQRYWDGRRWGPAVLERDAQHDKRAVRQQAAFVVLLMIIIAACYLLYDKPWQMHKAPRPVHPAARVYPI